MADNGVYLVPRADVLYDNHMCIVPRPGRIRLPNGNEHIITADQFARGERQRLFLPPRPWGRAVTLLDAAVPTYAYVGGECMALSADAPAPAWLEMTLDEACALLSDYVHLAGQLAGAPAMDLDPDARAWIATDGPSVRRRQLAVMLYVAGATPLLPKGYYFASGRGMNKKNIDDDPPVVTTLLKAEYVLAQRQGHADPAEHVQTLADALAERWWTRKRISPWDDWLCDHVLRDAMITIPASTTPRAQRTMRPAYMDEVDMEDLALLAPPCIRHVLLESHSLTNKERYVIASWALQVASPLEPAGKIAAAILPAHTTRERQHQFVDELKRQQLTPKTPGCTYVQAMPLNGPQALCCPFMRDQPTGGEARHACAQEGGLEQFRSLGDYTFQRVAAKGCL